MTRRHLIVIAMLLLAGCVSFASKEFTESFTSREYPWPQATVYQATMAVMKLYPMGIDVADTQSGLIKTNSGTSTLGLVGSTVGYRVQVQVEPIDERRTRVTPFFWMNVSSDPLKPNEIPIAATDNYRRYEDFYEAIEARLPRAPAAPEAEKGPAR